MHRLPRGSPFQLRRFKLRASIAGSRSTNLLCRSISGSSRAPPAEKPVAAGRRASSAGFQLRTFFTGLGRFPPVYRSDHRGGWSGFPLENLPFPSEEYRLEPFAVFCAPLKWLPNVGGHILPLVRAYSSTCEVEHRVPDPVPRRRSVEEPSRPEFIPGFLSPDSLRCRAPRWYPKISHASSGW